jgi:Fic family protein
MDLITTKQAAERWGISQRRVRTLCEQGKISGAVRSGKSYVIPTGAKKPTDGRFKPLSLNQLYEEIEIKKAELEKRRPLTAGELSRLNEEFAIEYTYNSNAIEGNTLTLKETALVLQGITIDQKPLREHLEATQHRDAFHFVCGLVGENIPLTEHVIKQIHSFILNDRPADRGVYRQAIVQIMGAVHTPPNPLHIPELMHKLLNSPKKETTNIVRRAAVFHLDFEFIHPFIDGNGRTGRLIANLELMKAGYPPIDIKFTDRRKYYDCFDDYAINNRADKMETLFAEYVLEGLKKYIAILK